MSEEATLTEAASASEQITHEWQINGKLVTFRQRFPLKTNRDLLPLLRSMGSEEENLDKIIELLSRTVESWEFDGDPINMASYEELDIVAEIYPMASAASQYHAARMQSHRAALKN